MILLITIETRIALDPTAIAPTLTESIATELGMTFGLGDGPKDNLAVKAIVDGAIVSSRSFDNSTGEGCHE